MPNYEYECEECGLRFERKQAITDAPLAKCPKCSGKVSRVVSGGAGFITKSPNPGRSARDGGGCSLGREGKTCCGRNTRCENPPCEEGS